MLVFTCFIFPLIFASIPSFSSGGGMAAGEAIETLIALGPFLHCVLMPFTWVRTHRRNAKVAAEEPPKTPELDPDAKTVIFSMKLKTCDKLAVRTSSPQTRALLAIRAHPSSCWRLQVVFIGLIFGLIAKVLWLVKTISFGTLNFEGFWFPAPFYQFWEAKLFIKNLQIDGCKIRTKATQDDAYMRFCEEAMLNFFTLGQRRRTPSPAYPAHLFASSRCHKQASTSGAAARRPASSAGSTAASCGSERPPGASTTNSASSIRSSR
jgi:hypothetical protein